MAFFNPANPSNLRNLSPLVTGYPFTVGIWFNTPNSTSMGLFGLCTSVSPVNGFVLADDSTQKINLRVYNGGVATQIASSSIFTDGRWVFVLGVFGAADSRVLAVLLDHGLTSIVTTSVSASPGATPDSITIGAAAVLSGSPVSSYNGHLAEFWMANIAVENVNTHLVRQLAYGGPFSVPHVAQSIVEYRALRKSFGSDTDEPGEVWRPGERVWTNNAAVIGEHPPLPHWYERPIQTKQQLFF